MHPLKPSDNSVARLKNHFLVFSVLMLICFATYSNALHPSFMMDDDDVFGNPIIKNPQHLGYYFIPDKNKYLGINGMRGESFYRPLSYGFLAVLYSFIGDDPVVYHVFNIVLLALACFVIYFFVLTLVRDPLWAFLTSLLFAVHPIHGLLVNYITANVYTMHVMTMILSVVLFLKAFDGHFRPFLYFLGSIFFIAALFFHETSIALPLYLVCLFYFHRKENFLSAAKKIIPLVIVLGVYFLLRMHYASLKTSILDHFWGLKINIFEYGASFAKVFFWYVSKLLYPDGVVLIWGTPVVRDHVLGWILGFGLFIAVSAMLIKKIGKNHCAMAMAWLLAGFAPVALACLCQPSVGFLMEPHWVIFPSLGFFILAGYLIARLHRSRSWWARVVFIFIVASWMLVSRWYNFLWADEVRYCRYWLTQVPGFKSVEFYLANAYLKKDQYDLARQYFQRSLSGDYTDYEAYTNMGLIDIKQEKFDSAIQNFQTGLLFNPSSTEIYNNLGVVYKLTQQFDKAEEAFHHALKINYFYVEPRLNLADIASTRGDVTQAIDLYQKNLVVAPYEGKSTWYLINLLLNKKDDKINAARIAHDFIGHSNDAMILTGIGSALAQAGLIPGAIEAYEKALRSNPGSKTTYVESGKLMGNLHQYDAALKLWEKALQLDPNDPQIRELINQANTLKKANL